MVIQNLSFDGLDLFRGFADLNYFLTFVRAAGGTNAMLHFLLTALGTDGELHHFR